eukprot:c26321_g1_i1.p1 GENE.c26321_g1_i1~~c26321_g1_i1.p1  ORF type:complete len:447 (-),score=51.77 c26321_g1_i1:14-1354(-)
MEEAERLRKEQHVSGHHGAPADFLLLTLASVPMMLALTAVLHGLLSRRLPGMYLVAIEVLASTLVFVLACTTEEQALLLRLYGTVSALCVGGWIAGLWAPRSALPMRAAVSRTRGALMLMTCVSILAVDFHAFPRMHAKTESYGLSLMDVGTGLIVFAMGFVARSGPRSLKSVATAALPLAVLGLLRPVLNAAVGYPTHISEYGRHWNFFLTLLVMLLVSAAMGATLELRGWAKAALGLFLSAAFEAALTSGGLSDYVLRAPREGDFISDNREGILSLYGYIAILLVGQGIGDVTLRAEGSRPPTDMCLDLLLVVAATGATLFISEADPSRRLVNFAYVLVTACLGAAVVLVGLCLELLGRQPAEAAEAAEAAAKPATVPADGLCWLADNMLAAFLLANLGTGLVNLSIRTLDQDDDTARSILVAYIMAVVFAVGLVGRVRSAIGV